MTGLEAQTCDAKGVYRLAVSNSEVYNKVVSLSVGTRTDILYKMDDTRFETLYDAQIKLPVYLGKYIRATAELFGDDWPRDS